MSLTNSVNLIFDLTSPQAKAMPQPSAGIFQTAPVGVFITAVTAMQAHASTSTFVTCAQGHIRCTSVHGETNRNFLPTTMPIPARGVPAPTLKPMPTPVTPSILNAFLQGYDDNLRQQLVCGFTEGFKLGYEGSRKNFLSKNLKSAVDNPDIVSEKISSELKANRIAGPFDKPPFPKFRTNPLGLVPKNSGSGFRMIHHLSYPADDSVNDAIPRDQCSVHYTSIQDAIKTISEMKGRVFLAKSDIANAFRLVPIHPDDYPLLGMQWGGVYYYDKCMPMGGASSCAIFEKFSTALHWIMSNQCPHIHICHVLDDFLFIANSFEMARDALSKFTSVCNEIGIPIAREKTMGPEEVLPFLGITLDTVKKEARLPHDKIVKCTQDIQELLNSKRVRLRKLQSVIGRLNFTLAVILPGRPFLRRLYDLTMGVKKAYHYVGLTVEAKDDLRMWLFFLKSFNGKSFFHMPALLSSTKLQMTTDASGSIGYGAVFGKSWFWGEWPARWKKFNIAVLEFYPVLTALRVWGEGLRNKNVVFVTDNEAIVSVINTQTTKHKQILFLLRQLVLECLQKNICFSAIHVSSKQNLACDLLSRAKIDEFFQVRPQASPVPTVVPAEFHPENLVSMPDA